MKRNDEIQRVIDNFDEAVRGATEEFTGFLNTPENWNRPAERLGEAPDLFLYVGRGIEHIEVARSQLPTLQRNLSSDDFQNKKACLNTAIALLIRIKGFIEQANNDSDYGPVLDRTKYKALWAKVESAAVKEEEGRDLVTAKAVAVSFFIATLLLSLAVLAAYQIAQQAWSVGFLSASVAQSVVLPLAFVAGAFLLLGCLAKCYDVKWPSGTDTLRVTSLAEGKERVVPQSAVSAAPSKQDSPGVNSEGSCPRGGGSESAGGPGSR